MHIEINKIDQQKDKHKYGVRIDLARTVWEMQRLNVFDVLNNNNNNNNNNSINLFLLSKETFMNEKDV